VVLDGCTSDRLVINAGVPQGSVLSPILFLIYINDLLATTCNPIHGFADDSTLHHSYKFDKVPKKEDVDEARKGMIETLSSDVDTLKCWVRANRVELNLGKTQQCRFSHKRTEMTTSLSMTDELDEAASLRMFLRRCKRFFTPPELAVIYKAYVRPLVEFNSHLWVGAPPSTLSLVESLQRKAFRLIGDHDVTDRVS